MGGILYVTGALADGTVTTAKLADDAVTDAKLANSINSAIAANTAKVQTTINNNADNRVITGSGTANTLNAESDVVIDSSGNLGIGAGTPRQKLHISASDSSSANMVFTNSTTGTSAGDGFIVGITGGEDAQLNMQESANLKFSTADTERMRITSDGKVGIGTDSPDFEFQVEDSSGAAVIRAKNGSNNYICDLIVDGTGGLVRTVGSQPLRFDTNQVERMRIDESGIVTKPYQPSFHANSGSTYWTHGSSTGTLDIDTVTTELFDVGGNYNASTCVFTAPVAGKYFFTFTYAYVCTSGYLNIHLKKGVSGTYSTYGKMFASPPQQSSAYSGPPVTGIVELAAGNTVKPMAELNYAGNQLVNVSFTGYLIG
jgi:hypothetical protein